MMLQTSLWIGLAAIWAGVSLAGNLVAAPAKFQVKTLDLPLALQVGRAQFTWIGYVEWTLLTGILAACLFSLRFPPVLLTAAISFFLLQQFWLQPRLQARSDQIITGEETAKSSLHFIFAGAEFLKFLLLIVYSTLGLYCLAQNGG